MKLIFLVYDQLSGKLIIKNKYGEEYFCPDTIYILIKIQMKRRKRYYIFYHARKRECFNRINNKIQSEFRACTQCC